MKTKSKSRRAFLVAGVGGAGVAAAAVAMNQQPGRVAEAAAKAPEGDGYRESAHIRKYYKTTEV
jgi:hypothetical protein